MTTKKQIGLLENKLLMLGLYGMAYTSIWNETAKKLNKLKLRLWEKK